MSTLFSPRHLKAHYMAALPVFMPIPEDELEVEYLFSQSFYKETVVGYIATVRRAAEHLQLIHIPLLSD